MSEERTPLLLRARVVKLNTDDGLAPLTEDVELGDVFLVDLSTRSVAVLMNADYEIGHEKEVVQCVETGGWLPMECLKLFV